MLLLCNVQIRTLYNTSTAGYNMTYVNIDKFSAYLLAIIVAIIIAVFGLQPYQKMGNSSRVGRFFLTPTCSARSH